MASSDSVNWSIPSTPAPRSKKGSQQANVNQSHVPSAAPPTRLEQADLVARSFSPRPDRAYNDSFRRFLRQDLAKGKTKELLNLTNKRDLRFRESYCDGKKRFNGLYGYSRTSAIVLMTGTEQRVACGHCSAGKGPFLVCVVQKDVGNGACANCIYGTRHSKCEYHSKHASESGMGAWTPDEEQSATAPSSKDLPTPDTHPRPEAAAGGQATSPPWESMAAKPTKPPRQQSAKAKSSPSASASATEQLTKLSRKRHAQEAASSEVAESKPGKLTKPSCKPPVEGQLSSKTAGSSARKPTKPSYKQPAEEQASSSASESSLETVTKPPRKRPAEDPAPAPISKKRRSKADHVTPRSSEATPRPSQAKTKHSEEKTGSSKAKTKFGEAEAKSSRVKARSDRIRPKQSCRSSNGQSLDGGLPKFPDSNFRHRKCADQKFCIKRKYMPRKGYKQKAPSLSHDFQKRPLRFSRVRFILAHCQCREAELFRRAWEHRSAAVEQEPLPEGVMGKCLYLARFYWRELKMAATNFRLLEGDEASESNEEA